MRLYHGTTYDEWQKISQGIDVKINMDSEKELDFGYGFYMSTRPWYAKKVAKDKASIKKSLEEYDEPNSHPVLIICDIDIQKILNETNADILYFRFKSLTFLHTVFNARYQTAAVDTIHKDIVFGPLADGNVDTVISWYKQKESIFRKLVCYIRFLLPVFTRQYVIKNQDLCQYIKLDYKLL